MLKVSCNVGMDQIALAQCGFLGRPMPLPAFTPRRNPAVSGRPLSKAPVLAVVSDRGGLGRAIVSGSGSLADRLRLGSLTEDGLSYKERFVVRSYEVGINKTATVETIANLLQVQNKTRKFIFWFNWVWFNFNSLVVLWAIFGSLASGFVGDILCHIHLLVFCFEFWRS